MREEVEAPAVANTDIRSEAIGRLRIASRFWWLVLGFLVAVSEDGYGDPHLYGYISHWACRKLHETLRTFGRSQQFGG